MEQAICGGPVLTFEIMPDNFQNHAHQAEDIFRDIIAHTFKEVSKLLQDQNIKGFKIRRTGMEDAYQMLVVR